jgi:hypothetical protein
MSKKNIPTDLPTTAVASSILSPEPQPLLPAVSKTENGKSMLSATPMDSLKEVEKGMAAEEAAGAGVWYSNKKVVGLWTIAQTRNAWANISDLGWKKFYNGSDSSIVAFNIIAGTALEKQTLVNVLIENDQIVEIYAW